MSATKKRWDIKRDAKRFCNLSFSAIKEMILKSEVKEDDLVLHTGMSDFCKAGEQEDLKPFFKQK